VDSRRRIVFLVTSVILCTVGALLLVSPAGATTATFTDPRACSPSVNDGVCISKVSTNWTGSTITLNMTVGTATDPNTDPNWEDSPYTGAAWNIFLNGNSSVSYTAIVADQFGTVDKSGNVIVDHKGPFAGAILNTQSNAYSSTCNWGTENLTPAFSTSKQTYGISLPVTCLGNPRSIAVNASYIYDTTGGTGEANHWQSPASADTSCCTVTSGSTPTTSTSTSTTVRSTTTTTKPKASTSTSVPSTTTTTSGLVASPQTNDSSSSTSPGELAATGVEQQVWWTAILGGMLLLLGALLLLFAEPPRRLLRNLSLIVSVRRGAHSLKALEGRKPSGSTDSDPPDG
jgi:LPXTG-motif cell wall-anchored protein